MAGEVLGNSLRPWDCEKSSWEGTRGGKQQFEDGCLHHRRNAQSSQLDRKAWRKGRQVREQRIGRLGKAVGTAG